MFAKLFGKNTIAKTLMVTPETTLDGEDIWERANTLSWNELDRSELFMGNVTNKSINISSGQLKALLEAAMEEDDYSVMTSIDGPNARLFYWWQQFTPHLEGFGVYTRGNVKGLYVTMHHNQLDHSLSTISTLIDLLGNTGVDVPVSVQVRCPKGALTERFTFLITPNGDGLYQLNTEVDTDIFVETSPRPLMVGTLQDIWAVLPTLDLKAFN